MKEYMNGTLSEADKASVEQHLAGCLFCSEAMEGLGTVGDHNKTSQAVNDIDSRVDDIVNKQVNIKRPEIRRIDKTWMYISAAATVLALVGLFTLYKLQDQPVDNMISEHISSTDKQKNTETTNKKIIQEPTGDDSRKNKQSETTPPITNNKTIAVESVDVNTPENIEQTSKATKPAIKKGDEMVEEKLLQNDLEEEAPEMANDVTAGQDDVSEEKQEIAVVGYGAMKKGSIKRKESASNNTTSVRSSPVPNAFSEEDEIFYKLEEMPRFKGGGKNVFKQYVQENIRYPEDAVAKGKEGTVLVKFTVTREGNIENVEVTDGIYPSLDKQAVRVISASPKWSPGIQNGKPVDVRFIFPVIFSLNE